MFNVGESRNCITHKMRFWVGDIYFCTLYLSLLSEKHSQTNDTSKYWIHNLQLTQRFPLNLLLSSQVWWFISLDQSLVLSLRSIYQRWSCCCSYPCSTPSSERCWVQNHHLFRMLNDHHCLVYINPRHCLRHYQELQQRLLRRSLMTFPHWHCHFPSLLNQSLK